MLTHIWNLYAVAHRYRVVLLVLLLSTLLIMALVMPEVVRAEDLGGGSVCAGC